MYIKDILLLPLSPTPFHLPLEADQVTLDGIASRRRAGMRYLCSLQYRNHRAAQRGGAFGDVDASGAHRIHLGGGGIVSAADDGAGMAHAPARRRGGASDEADSGLLYLLTGEEVRRVDLAVAADLADHDDLPGFLVGQEHLQYLDEIGALDRVPADTDTTALPKPGRRGLRPRR